jgi:hypothetical protein
MNDLNEGNGEMNVPARTVARGDVIESVIMKGDLSRLSADERTQYYVQLCQSMGLNPHTQPFAYITLNGKLTLYAKRDAADQLRKINGISIEVISRSIEDGLFTVHVRATDRSNRTDEDFGVVALPDTLKGEARANIILKGITKAKRRVTLSISGLGFLDETEIETIPGAAEGFRKQAAETRRKLGGAKEVIWDEESVREPTAEEIHEIGEDRSDQWGDAQGDRLMNAINERPAHDADGVVLDEVPTSKAQFLATTREHIRVATDGVALANWWNSEEQKQARRDFELTRNEFASIRDFIAARLKALKEASHGGT